MTSPKEISLADKIFRLFFLNLFLLCSPPFSAFLIEEEFLSQGKILVGLVAIIVATLICAVIFLGLKSILKNAPKHMRNGLIDQENTNYILSFTISLCLGYIAFWGVIIF